MDRLDYGVIGNCRSAALISRTGSIEWCCLPDFNSASVFATILDREKGGEFSIITDDSYLITQHYCRDTNILITRFQNRRHAFQVIDFMPRYKTDRGGYHCPPDIIRYFNLIKGKPRLNIRYRPRLSYARYETYSQIEEDAIKSSNRKGIYESIYLYSNFEYKDILDEKEIVLQSDSFCLLSYNQKVLKPTTEKIYLEYKRTEVYWLDWVNRSRFFTKYNEEIIRSSLVLKLLTFQETGAILAAITTSIPEVIGEKRNWDYRYCWIRDSSMIISVLTTLGHYKSAMRFLNFIVDLIPYKNDKMQIMYGIRGEKNLKEKVLYWLEGYEHSKPVRIGNAAYIQKQNDIYGVLLDVIYRCLIQFQNEIDNVEDLWTVARGLLRTVEKTWMKPDTSIWEYRTNRRHFVFSKVLSWVAFDRGVKIAGLLKKESLYNRWAEIRDLIKKDILKKGWNESVGAFTQAYNGTELDAANLLMAHYNFISYTDPRYIRTVHKIKESLLHEGLMYRYRNPDDFGVPRSSFTVCTFWMIKSLYLIGNKKEAIDLFHQVLKYANHLGLFSEDIDFKTKRLLGNFPQGYSHLALIDAAITLSEKHLDEETEIVFKLEEMTASLDKLNHE